MQAGSGGRQRRRLHRRRPDQFRLRLRRAEAAARAQASAPTQVIARLRRKLDQVAGRVALPASGAGHPRRRPRRATRSTSTRCRATTSTSSTAGRRRSTAALQKLPELTDVNSDQQQNGLETDLVIDRATAARLGLTVSQIDNTLYDAFGQRQVSTIYNRAQPVSRRDGGRAAVTGRDPTMLKRDLCQHRRRRGQRRRNRRNAVVAGTTARAKQRPRSRPRRRSPAIRRATRQTNSLANTGAARASTGAAVSTSAETMVPLSAFSHYGPGNDAARGQSPGSVRRRRRSRSTSRPACR